MLYEFFTLYLPKTITFAVYGVIDEQRETWLETNSNPTPKWEEAPSYISHDENAVNTSEVKLLGKSEINRGQQQGKYAIDTKELLGIP